MRIQYQANIYPKGCIRIKRCAQKKGNDDHSALIQIYPTLYVLNTLVGTLL